MDIWEALEGLPPGQSRVNFKGEDRMLQQAIEIIDLVKMRAQLKQAVAKMVTECCTYLDN